MQDTPNDGSYLWTAPDVTSDNVTFTITGTDLATDVDTDFSEAFSIVGTASSGDTDSSVSEEEAAGTTAEGSGVMGVSPVTGEAEEISTVAAGDYIRGASYDTVYYVDADMLRHPFMDAQTYFTYQDDFDSLLAVTDATLTSLTLGGPMLPNAGVVLVKVQSIAKVYAVVINDDGETELRWITSEAVATSLYGSAWADYVIDIPDTLWPRFEVGDDVDAASDLEVDTDSMKTRMEVNS